MNTSGNYTTNQGDLILEQIGNNVNGRYSKIGVLEGSISGNIITGIWKNSGKTGLFEFVFSDDNSFNGKYKNGIEQGTMRSKWDGQIANLNNTEAITDKTTQEKNEPKSVSEKKNGTAKWVDDDGNIFDGTWENDILIKGIITYHDGIVEEGEFNEKGLNGEGNATYDIDEEVSVIENGFFKEGFFIKGTATYNNGRIEEGEFNEDGLNGKGKCSYKDDDDKLVVEEGEFKDGNLINGTIIWEDGTSEEGEFNEDGDLIKGIISYKDDELVIKEGEFKDGVLIKGKSQRGEWSKSEGEFNEEGLNGEGIRLYKSGCFEKGIFKDGIFIEGTCKMINDDDDDELYEGEIKDRKRHGTGTQKYKNGDFYEGEFKEGKRHGTGIFYDKNTDSVREGKWFLDKIVLSEIEKKQEEKERNERVKANQLYFKQLEKEREKEEKEREKEEKEREKNRVRKFRISYTYVKDGSSMKWGEYIYIHHKGQTITESQARTYVKSKDYYISRGKGKLIGIKNIEAI